MGLRLQLAHCNRSLQQEAAEAIGQLQIYLTVWAGASPPAGVLWLDHISKCNDTASLMAKSEFRGTIVLKTTSEITACLP